MYFGRPVEQFEQHGLFVGKTVTLGKPPSSETRLNVRLVEIKRPAVIVGASNINGLPLEYKSGLLDLVATADPNASGADDAPAQKINLFMRLAGTDAHVRRFKSIKLHFWPIMAAGEGPEKVVDITFGKRGQWRALD